MPTFSFKFLVLVGALALPLRNAGAEPKHDPGLAGTWCVRYTSGSTATNNLRVFLLVYQFGADGSVTVINSNQGAPAPANPPVPQAQADVYTRSAGLGQLSKVGPHEWAADYQYLDFVNGVLKQRFVASMPIVHNPQADTISNAGKAIGLKFADPSGHPITRALPPQSYVGTRMDPKNPLLCDLSVDPRPGE